MSDDAPRRNTDDEHRDESERAPRDGLDDTAAAHLILSRLIALRRAQQVPPDEAPQCDAPGCDRLGITPAVYSGPEGTRVYHWCLVHDPEADVEQPGADDKPGDPASGG